MEDVVVLEVTLCNLASAAVGGGGSALFGELRVADREAVHMDIHAIPSGGDVHRHTGGRAFGGRTENGLVLLGAVGHEINIVVVVSAGLVATTSDGAADLQVLTTAVVHLTEGNLGEIAIRYFEAAVVHSDVVGGVGGDFIVVVLDEHIAFGQAILLGGETHANLNGIEEGASKLASEAEFGAVGLLCLGARVSDVGLIHSHDSAAFPSATDSITELTDLGSKIALIVLRHSCLSFS